MGAPYANKVAAYARPTCFPLRYKVALFILTALAFVTRFWNIGHPNEVVFDEVHFGKVRLVYRFSSVSDIVC